MSITTEFYIIMDQMTVWGAGVTLDAAYEDAAQWLENPETGFQGCSVEQVEAMEILEHESKNGADGIFVYEITDFEWPENAAELDGDGWMEFYWKQEELNA